jgi:hypothetical protein
MLLITISFCLWVLTIPAMYFCNSSLCFGSIRFCRPSTRKQSVCRFGSTCSPSRGPFFEHMSALRASPKFNDHFYKDVGPHGPQHPVCCGMRCGHQHSGDIAACYRFINSFAGNFGFRTFSAVSTPATGNVFASIRPSCVSTDA